MNIYILIVSEVDHPQGWHGGAWRGHGLVLHFTRYVYNYPPAPTPIYATFIAQFEIAVSFLQSTAEIPFLTLVVTVRFFVITIEIVE